MPAGGLLSFKPHRENWDSKRWAEEEAGRDSLRPPVCPWPPAFLGQMSGPSLNILLEMCHHSRLLPLSAPFPALASQALLAQTDLTLHFCRASQGRHLALARSSPWAEPDHVLRTLSYTIHFLVFTLLVGSRWGQKQAPRNGIHTSRSSLAPLSFTITPESACLWVSRQEPPRASHPQSQAYLLGTIVPRGNV